MSVLIPAINGDGLRSTTNLSNPQSFTKLIWVRFASTPTSIEPLIYAENSGSTNYAGLIPVQFNSGKLSVATGAGSGSDGFSSQPTWTDWTCYAITGTTAGANSLIGYWQDNAGGGFAALSVTGASFTNANDSICNSSMSVATTVAYYMEWNTVLTPAQLATQFLSPIPIVALANLSRYLPLANAATAGSDQSGNGYGMTVTGTLTDGTSAPTFPLYPLATDDFNRANGAPGANWTDYFGIQSFDIVSDQIQNTGFATSAFGAGLYSGYGPWPNNQWSLIEVNTINTDANHYIACLLRGSTSANTSYRAWVTGPLGSGCIVNIGKLVAGTFTLLGSTSAETWASGDTLLVTIVGFTITAYHNGVQVLQETDSGSSIASGTPGVLLANNQTAATDTIASNWAGGGFGVSLALAEGSFAFTGRTVTFAIAGAAAYHLLSAPGAFTFQGAPANSQFEIDLAAGSFGGPVTDYALTAAPGRF